MIRPLVATKNEASGRQDGLAAAVDAANETVVDTAVDTVVDTAVDTVVDTAVDTVVDTAVETTAVAEPTGIGVASISMQA